MDNLDWSRHEAWERDQLRRISGHDDLQAMIEDSVYDLTECDPEA